MSNWSAAESIAATLLVLSGVGGGIAAAVSLIELFKPMKRRPDRADDKPKAAQRGPKKSRGQTDMIENLSLVELPRMTRADDTETSREAASILRDALGDLRYRVWHILSKSGEGGLADFELRAACEADMGKRPESTYRKRRSELSAMGLAIETGHRRLNANGRAEVVHRARTFDEVAEMIAHLKTLDRQGRKAWIAANKSAKAVQEAAE